MNHRRLASLAVAAALVLVLGLLVRSRLERANRPAPAAPPSEASALQQLSHEGLLRRASAFITERASTVARYVVYVPASAASGVRWRADTVVTAGRRRAIDMATMASADSGTPTIRQAGDSIRNAWLLVVGRARGGAVLSLAAAVGGRVRARCDARDVDELLLNVPLHDHLAGAGVFDIDGALVAVVLRCGQRLAAISAGQIAGLLDQRDSSASATELLGASLIPLDSVARAYFATDTGVLVSAVRAGSVARSVGLRPGDVLLSVDGVPVTSGLDASRAVAARPDTTHRIVRLRGRARAIVDIRASAAPGVASADGLARGLGMELTPEPSARGATIARVEPGSLAHAAGLRTGDRLTRVGSTDVASRVIAERLLRAAPPGPIFIAFERDSLEYGALVQR